MADQLKAFELAAGSTSYLPEKLAEIKSHRDWLKTAPAKYAGEDHWKIPFPTNTPSI
jgi:hypothetical protein